MTSSGTKDKSYFSIPYETAISTYRKTVSTLLSDHPLVESFRDGEPSEGGAGATVAALKVG